MPLTPLHSLRRWLLPTAIALFASAPFAQTSALRPTPMPLRLVAPDARLPIQLARVAVQATVLGLQAQTRLELTLHNPNARVLEATLEFPLADGQSVSGFALDINGELVPAVPVPKDKGRQVFDDVTRQRVDPALLERTVGNNFKLRVYPLPPGGTRRVVLQLAERLPVGPQGRVQYRLPLDFGQRIADFSAELAVQGAAAVQTLGALRGSKALVDGPRSVLRFQRSHWQAREALALQWKHSGAELLHSASFEQRDYFYAEVPLDAAPGTPVLPREVQLVWDASGSGAQRDHAREFALLDALFNAARNVRVQLVLARDVAEAPQAFDVQAGDWRALRKVLETVAYDGASNPAAWMPPAASASPSGAHLALLFSDGLANWPGVASAPAAGAAPLFTISAAARADSARLRRLAEAGGGRFIDLGRMTAGQALDALTRPALRLVDVQARGAERVLAASVHPENGRLALAGVMSDAQARLTLTLADGQGRRSTRTLDVKAPPNGQTTGSDMVPLPAQRWAQLTVAQLEGDRQRHRAEIRRLGEEFRLLTDETSLIVLEAVADYLRYAIVPPAGALRAQYLEQQARRGATREQSRSAHIDRLAQRFADKQRWWAREFPKDTPPPAPPSPPRPLAMAAPAPAAMMAAPPPPPRPAPMGMAEAADARVASATAAQSQRASAARPAAQDAAAAPNARIELRRWEPDAPYARRLRDAANDEQRYAIYLDERPGQLASTAFFIDAADIFFAKGQPALAQRVLSNLAEMELENRHILRILAYRLQQAGLQALAIPLLERVRELAPDEPQSGRDLGLALAADGQMQRALELLWDVASRPWDNRFSDIDLIALAELNAVVAQAAGAGKPLDTSTLDKRLLHNLPLDLRAVLTWDADNTDIDLWVTDPNGERAFYGRRLTYQGGAMTRDFTGGYGPEEFSLRLAKPGRYEVRAEFYGHRQQIVSPYTTLMLWLSTGFGTAGQKDERVVLRLSGQRQNVLVGSFEVAAPAGAASAAAP